MSIFFQCIQGLKHLSFQLELVLNNELFLYIMGGYILHICLYNRDFFIQIYLLEIMIDKLYKLNFFFIIQSYTLIMINFQYHMYLNK